MHKFQVGLFADGVIGYQVVDFMIKQHREDVAFICIVDDNSSIKDLVIELGFSKEKIYCYNQIEQKLSKNYGQPINYFILAWWPYIVRKWLLQLPLDGTINFHPSFLPYNRGKHPSFWNIIESVPFGVTLHFVDESIDSGDIIFQKKIATNWEDTGKSLYDKALMEIFNLFTVNYNNIKTGNYTRTKQGDYGSFHYAKELEKVIEINLDHEYSARYLFNLLRAKNFPDSSKCFFYDEGKKYSVEITIKGNE